MTPRQPPPVDTIAFDYLVLALSMGRLQEGLVDAYYGPAEPARAAEASTAGPLEQAAKASALRDRLPSEVDDDQRRLWLDRQLVALETVARRLGGVETSYPVEVELCFDAPAEPTPEADYVVARSELEQLLPGTGDLRARLTERDKRLTVPPERMAEIVDWLVAELRERALELFDAPAGDSLSVTSVTDQPWSAYNWYEGDLRSRIEINTDLPMRAPQLIGLLAHEAYPGHHLEHAWKEAHLVAELGRAEASVQLINTPEAYISEGLAEVGARFVAGDGQWQELLLGICGRAGIALDQAAAEREFGVSRTLLRLRGSSGDAALQLHAQGRPRADVVNFLERDALRSREQAEKSLEFISHPLWRTYVFCYAGGERLLDAWLDSMPDEESRRASFKRLLTEQLTPSGIGQQVPASQKGH